MQRRLLMIRHAKSSWSNPMQSDFDRPLNSRGRRDAPDMGERLKEMNVVPDIIYSSTAKRAKATAIKIAKVFGIKEEQIVWYDKLYHCIPSVFEEVIYEIDDNVKTAFIVAHNPGITDFANDLSSQFKIDNVPTCGIVGASFDANEWNDFNRVNKQVFLFDYPKKRS